MAVRNLIFDLDGTLIDSSAGVVEAVNYSLRQMGQPEQPAEAIKPFIGYPLNKMYPGFTDAPVRELRRHFQVKAAQVMVTSTEVLPGAEDTLLRLRREGYRLAVATTKIRRHVDGILKKFAWQDLFEAVAGGDEVEQVKPDPSIFRLLLGRLGAKASDTITIGDTENDVLAARAVPMKVVAVRSPYGGVQKVLGAGPDYFIESLTELFRVLEQARQGVI